ncbi:MAG: fatty acid desaturase [Deltaproteobacteria bacterium]|nr:fatty acid desaturase [Deltaproteobacteria bacterium]
MAETTLGGAPLVPLSHYVHAIKPELPAEAFTPARSRLAWIPVHFAIIAVAAASIALGWVPWFVYPVLGLVIGVSFSCLTFLAHESMHGGVVRDKRARMIVGWIGFLPFMVAPRLWAAWHDRVHHATANFPDDPDIYPTLKEYEGSSRIRFFVNAFSLGGRRWRGVLSLVLGFSVQSLHQLIASERSGFLSKKQRRIAIAETLLGGAFWLVVAFVVGFVPFLFIYVMPLVVANMIVMSFILTNHNLSPRVTVNDPLASGLSVTSHRAWEFLTLGFGYHVEHHLFPAMSSRHAKAVRTLVLQKWPERYQSMPLTTALGKLHSTARVYKDDTTLIDPLTGAEFPTLMPRVA